MRTKTVHEQKQEDKKMLLTEQSTAKKAVDEPILTDKKQPKKLSARWKLIDGKLVCRWSTK